MAQGLAKKVAFCVNWKRKEYSFYLKLSKPKLAKKPFPVQNSTISVLSADKKNVIPKCREKSVPKIELSF